MKERISLGWLGKASDKGNAAAKTLTAISSSERKNMIRCEIIVLILGVVFSDRMGNSQDEIMVPAEFGTGPGVCVTLITIVVATSFNAKDFCPIVVGSRIVVAWTRILPNCRGTLNGTLVWAEISSSFRPCEQHVATWLHASGTRIHH